MKLTQLQVETIIELNKVIDFRSNMNKYSKDPLGERMKGQYEVRSRPLLPRRTYTIIRLDGKAFHTYTRKLKKPFDENLIDDMDNAVVKILPEIMGVQFAYVQSDEVSILLTDFSNENTDAWFDGNVQKMVSVSSSFMTAEFNKLRMIRKISQYRRQSGVSSNFFYDRFFCSEIENVETATFDSRVFTIPDRVEVMNYFIWRNNDAARNSISMVAQSLYSHKELHGKSSADKQEMIFKKGINWNDYDKSLKNGRLIVREEYEAINNSPNGEPNEPTIRTRWVVKPADKFTQSKESLLNMIPKYN
jgi:tRNA(His) guanylyltransferase